MSLLVINFTYLEGRDGELLVKELAAVDSHRNRVSSYIFKKPYGWEEVPMFNARINELLATGVIGMMVMCCIQSWKLCSIARHYLLLQSIASDL